MIGALGIGIAVARKARQVKQAVGEVKDVLDSLDDLTSSYGLLLADEKITTDEIEELILRISRLVNETVEARAVLTKIIL